MKYLTKTARGLKIKSSLNDSGKFLEISFIKHGELEFRSEALMVDIQTQII